jgi:hypothetical protein
VRYSHTIHEGALRSLFALGLPERRKMLNECEIITRRPSAEPDYIRTESDGRAMSVVVRGNHAIVYWVDHGARLVYISRIDPAD